MLGNSEGRDERRGQTVELFRTMCRIRHVENALAKLFADGEVPGFIHLSIGQEAVAAGVVGSAGPADTLATTHRGHGHVIARGMALGPFFREIMGKAGGICRGRGGSMHVCDLTLGILGANGIVGAGLPLAVGSALAHKHRGTDGVAIVFFGDGAMAEGALHECLNMASLWGLPILFVCENNGWSEFSPTVRQFAASLADIAAAFGIAHRRVDGNDVAAVAEASAEFLAQARQGAPRILECLTTRVRGHFEGDPQSYRSPGEMAELPSLDPLESAKRLLIGLGVADAEVGDVEDRELGAVAAAIEEARGDVLPDFAEALRDVYTAQPELSGAAGR
jgi:acetoin:2,6-dichlorophenolindophenol oxidoreductase subunit alpha